MEKLLPSGGESHQAHLAGGEDGKEAWIPVGPHKEDLLEDELSHARGERKLR